MPGFSPSLGSWVGFLLFCRISCDFRASGVLSVVAIAPEDILGVLGSELQAWLHTFV